MVIPLNKPTHVHISRQFQLRQVEKSYHAIVYGVIQEDRGEIDLPIATDWADRPRQKICRERGRSALTRYEVHMRELGHPILGCDMYAHPEALAMASRLMLHASKLAFEHPGTGEWLAGECAPDF